MNIFVPVVHIICDPIALSIVSATTVSGPTPKTIESLNSICPHNYLLNLLIPLFLHFFNTHSLSAFYAPRMGWGASQFLSYGEHSRNEKGKRVKEYDLCQLTSLVMLGLRIKHHRGTHKIIFSALINVVRDTCTMYITQIFIYKNTIEI